MRLRAAGAVGSAAAALVLGTAGVAWGTWATSASGQAGAASDVLAAPTGLTVSQLCTPTYSPRLATIAHRSSAAATGSGTVTVSAPAGIQAGDLLVAAHADQYDTAPTPPAGWTARGDVKHSTANSLSVSLYTRFVQAGDPTTYSWSAATGPAVLTVSAYSGVDTANPLNGAAATGTGTSVVAPSITPAAAPTRLVGLFSVRAASTLTAPASMTQRSATTGTDGTATPVTVMVADEPQATTAATGTRTATGTVAGNSIGALIALAPAKLPGTITFQGQISGSGTTSVSLTVPTAARTGDLLLVGYGKRLAATTTIATPAGWTRSRPSDLVTDAYQQTVFWKVATASDPGTAHSFTSTTTGGSLAAMTVYRGVDQRTPLLIDTGLAAGSATTIKAPSLTPARADSLLVGIFGVQNDGTVPAVPVGMSQRSSSAITGGNQASRLAIVVSDEPWPSGAATGDRTATGVSGNVVGQLIALKPESYPSLALSWTASASPYVESHRVDLYRDGAVVGSAVVSPATTTTHTTGTLDNGATYRVEVRAQKASWHSPGFTDAPVTTSC